MSDSNPYDAPNADVSGGDDGGRVLAGRGMRLFAYIIDSIILGIALAVVFGLLFGGFALMGGSGSDGIMSWLEANADSLDTNILFLVGTVVVIGLVYLLVNGYLLSTQGQTVAKKLLGMRIVRHGTDELLPLGSVFGIRWFLFVALNQIPLVGFVVFLVDSLFVFREDQRCLHDLAAGTDVVAVAKQ